VPVTLAMLTIFGLSGCTQEYPADEFFLRGHLQIPTDVQMLSLFATPETISRLWGRQNLLIKAKFKFKDQKQFDDYLVREQVKQNWNLLPIPDKVYIRLEELDRFRQADLKQIDAMKDGYWLCETTAGRGFLKEPSQGQTVFSKYPPSEPDRDYLVAGVDAKNLELYVVIKQDY
jgi:hypothetical protein